MATSELLHEIERIVGREYVSAGRLDTEVYSYDASLALGTPDAVVLPGDTEATAAVMRAAARAGLACIPRGFGTNLSGGSVAPQGGLIVELSRLDRILEINPQGRYAVVQPGVTNLELQNALAPLGFYYAPDPASQKVSTLGGNLGENSGGPHCLKYGVTTNHVLGMTMVLGGGRVMRIGGATLDPPGYDLRGVLVGSEGTLAIVTEMVLRILPLVESVVTLLVVYDDVAHAARSVSDIIAAGIVPATLEMMDATVIRAVEESKPCGYPLDAAAVLIVEVDGPAAGLARQADEIAQLCRKNQCREVRKAKDDAQRNLLWAGRRGAFGAISRLAPNYLVADCTVPRSLLPQALKQVAVIVKKHGLAHGNVFHAGDGNLHPLILFDSRDADQLHRVHEAGREIMEACTALGGTITGEHGIGSEKAHAMRMIFSDDDLDFQQRLCHAFDPQGLVNPGKIFPPDLKPWHGHPARVEATTRARCPCHDSGELIPADVDEACALIGRACLDRVALLPRGNGTQGDFGSSVNGQGVILRSSKLKSLIEFDHANQVVMAQSGMTLGELQKILAPHDQWLPIRPPGGGSHTLGGIVALGTCGPERLRYGSPRDLLLGLKFISADGRLISAGGRVVKNVAGYDVTRLMTGSAGTLGLLTELTFRTAPLPRQCVALAACGSLQQCSAAAEQLLQSNLEANFIVAAPAHSTLQFEENGKWQLTAGFEGFGETLDAQSESCRALFQKAGLGNAATRQYSPLEGGCGPLFVALRESPFRLRMDLPLDKVAGFLSQHENLPRQTAVLADFGCGRILASMSELREESWRRLCQLVVEAGGHVVVERSPHAFRREQEVFGMIHSDWARSHWTLMHKIKSALDPHHIFAPDRLPGKESCV